MLSITPFLWFDDQAAEAARFYTSIFPDSRILDETPMSVAFEVAGQRVMGLNGGPQFQLNEAFSMFVSCDGQEEVDHYWDALLEGGGEPSMCGWLKDRFGLSWQVIPSLLGQLLSDPDQGRANRVMQAMLGMRKIDCAGLQAAYDAQ
ncbi:MAG: VOC family protein [Dehalococcoidia bacterium]